MTKRKGQLGYQLCHYIFPRSNIRDARTPGGFGARREELTGLVSEVNQESTDNGLVDLYVSSRSDRPIPATYPVGDPQCLSVGGLGALQRLLDSAQRLGVEGLGGSDDNLEFTTVSSDERVEVGEDLLGGTETAVLGEDGEEVEEDGGGGGWDKAGKSLDSVGGGEGGVF